MPISDPDAFCALAPSLPGTDLKAVIFDFNGVLVDDLPIQEEAYWRASVACGHPRTREQIRQSLPYAPARKRELLFGSLTESAWQRLFSLKTEVYQALVRDHRTLFAHTETVLRQLSDHYDIYLLSNTLRSDFEAVFPPHLAVLFKDTVFADEVSQAKPSPAGLMDLLAKHGLNVHGCCYVGDAVTDVQMCRAAGIRCIALSTGFDHQQTLAAAGAKIVLQNLGQLATLLLPGGP